MEEEEAVLASAAAVAAAAAEFAMAATADAGTMAPFSCKKLVKSACTCASFVFSSSRSRDTSWSCRSFSSIRSLICCRWYW